MNGQTNDCIAILAHAVSMAGGADALARHLHVDSAQIWNWIGGRDVPPPEVFMRTLELLERRSLAVQRQDCRVRVSRVTR